MNRRLIAGVLLSLSIVSGFAVLLPKRLSLSAAPQKPKIARPIYSSGSAKAVD
jgi:hypothetical protein